MGNLEGDKASLGLRPQAAKGREEGGASRYGWELVNLGLVIYARTAAPLYALV